MRCCPWPSLGPLLTQEHRDCQSSSTPELPHLLSALNPSPAHPLDCSREPGHRLITRASHRMSSLSDQVVMEMQPTPALEDFEKSAYPHLVETFGEAQIEPHLNHVSIVFRY